jgi:antitoxin component YwqK of YwqJK toxin-antitoxin module
MSPDAPPIHLVLRDLKSRVVVLGIIVGGLIVFFLFTSQRKVADPAVVEVPRKDLILRDGRLFQRGDAAPFLGLVTEYYVSGELKSRSVVSNGLLHGLSEGWHTNGQRQVAEHFYFGVSHGLRTKWYPGGQKLSEITIVDGKLDGTFRRWHEAGLLAEELPLKQGEPDGWSRSFYESGCVKAQARFEHGKMLQQQFWKDGEQRESGLTAVASGQ